MSRANKFRQAMASVVFWGRIGFVCLGLVAVAYSFRPAHAAARKVQSPRAASQSIGARQLAIGNLQPPVPTMASAASTASAAAAVAITNRPLNVRLLWDASPAPGITNYSIWWGVASGRYTNSANAGTNLTLTISNPVRGVKYYFAATCQDRSGAASPFSAEYFWPQPVTNYVLVTFLHRTNLTAAGSVLWTLVLTNPPGDQAFVETRITQTNNAVNITRIDTSTLRIANTNQP